MSKETISAILRGLDRGVEKTTPMLQDALKRKDEERRYQRLLQASAEKAKEKRAFDIWKIEQGQDFSRSQEDEKRAWQTEHSQQKLENRYQAKSEYNENERILKRKDEGLLAINDVVPLWKMGEEFFEKSESLVSEYPGGRWLKEHTLNSEWQKNKAAIDTKIKSLKGNLNKLDQGPMALAQLEGIEKALAGAKNPMELEGIRESFFSQLQDVISKEGSHANLDGQGAFGYFAERYELQNGVPLNFGAFPAEQTKVETQEDVYGNSHRPASLDQKPPNTLQQEIENAEPPPSGAATAFGETGAEEPRSLSEEINSPAKSSKSSFWQRNFNPASPENKEIAEQNIQEIQERVDSHGDKDSDFLTTAKSLPVGPVQLAADVTKLLTLGQKNKEIQEFVEENLIIPYSQALGLDPEGFNREESWKEAFKNPQKWGAFLGSMIPAAKLFQVVQKGAKLAFGSGKIASAVSRPIAGASLGAVHNPDHPGEGAIMGAGLDIGIGLMGKGLTKAGRGISDVLKTGKKNPNFSEEAISKVLGEKSKYAKGNRTAKVSQEEAEKLMSRFSSPNISIPNIVQDPQLIKYETKLGRDYISRGFHDKKVSTLMEELEGFSGEISKKYSKNPEALGETLKKLEKDNQEIAKKIYQPVQEKIENSGKPFSKNGIKKLLSNKYENKPELDLLNSENTEFYKLKLFQSEVRATKRAMEKRPRGERPPGFTKEYNALKKDLNTLDEIFQPFTQELKAADKEFLEKIVPFRHSKYDKLTKDLWTGKPSYDFFRNAKKDAPVVAKRIREASPKAFKDVLANTIDEGAENLSLASFKNISGGRGNHASQKSRNLNLTAKELEEMAQNASFYKHLQSFSGQETPPLTGIQAIETLGNPKKYSNPSKWAEGFLSLLGGNRSLRRSKILSNRKNLKYYFKPELLEKSARNKKKSTREIANLLIQKGIQKKDKKE